MQPWDGTPWKRARTAAVATVVAILCLPIPIEGQIRSASEAELGANISEKVLERFALAFGDVYQIFRDLQRDLRSTPQSAQTDELVREANDQMVRAIRGQRLPTHEFNKLLRAISNDPKLLSRVRQIQQQVDTGGVQKR